MQTRIKDCGINNHECNIGSRIVKGYCKLHYTRWQKHGDPMTVSPPVSRTKTAMPCIHADGCDATNIEAGGLCRKHYQQLKRSGGSIVPTKYISKTGLCTYVDGTIPCTNEHQAKGYCGKHYARFMAHGDPSILLQAHNGAGTIMPNG